MSYICPVCAFTGLYDDPYLQSYEICPQCSVEFGYDDANTPHTLLRERWITAGRPHWRAKMDDLAWCIWYDLHLHPEVTP